jgi:hypothetical protein
MEALFSIPIKKGNYYEKKNSQQHGPSIYCGSVKSYAQNSLRALAE